MDRLVIKHAQVLVTMDDTRREIADGAVYVEKNVIKAVGNTSEVMDSIKRINTDLSGITQVDATGCVVLPGLINTHHHLFQTLTRTYATGSGLKLFDWLLKLAPVWGQMDSEAVYVSAKVGLAELLLSGATTVADNLYLYPNDCKIDDEIKAAKELGVRFHPTRGSVTINGPIWKDEIVESQKSVLADCERVIAQFHDPEEYSMLRIGLAPVTPFSCAREHYIQAARLARRYKNVGLHTHLCETADELEYMTETYGVRTPEWMRQVEWGGKDVWFAHVIHLDDQEIKDLSVMQSGVAHCPSSNMILGSGIPRIREMIQNGVHVSLGVDGSASNDGNQMLGEARQAMLLQRVQLHANEFPARKALELATLGGADVLNRPDLGSLEVGKAADIVAFRVDGLSHAGAQSDVVSALVTCSSGPAWLNVVNGRILVQEGELLGVDLGELVKRHNEISQSMMEKANTAKAKL